MRSVVGATYRRKWRALEIGKLELMSDHAVELLEAFDALPPDDKQAFAMEVLRRTRDFPIDSGPVADEEIGDAGRSLFGFVDQVENASATR